MKQLTRTRTEYIDIARGAVIILMLIGHSGAPKLLTQLIYGFHMPFFFMLSGLLYNRSKWEEKGFKELVVSKFKAYLIPYFILCGINIGLELIYDLVSGYSFDEFTQEGARSIFWALYSYSTKARMGTSVPLWFLPCIFLSTIVVWAVFKIKNRVLKVALFAGFWAVNIALNMINSPILPWHMGLSLIGAGFMFVGFYLRFIFDRLFSDMYSYESSSKTDEVMLLGHLKRTFCFATFMLSLVAVFVLCTLSNGKVDINMREFGKYPALFILGSISMSVFVLFLFKNVIRKSAVLKFFGRNTIVIMGFNYTINFYSKIFWQKSILRGIVSYNWIIVCLLDVVCCAVLINAKKRLDMYRALNAAS